MPHERQLREPHTELDALRVADADDWHIEDAIDGYLAHMDAAAMEAHLVRKRAELTSTFVRCPAWAVDLLPALAMTAFRLELARSFRQKAFSLLALTVRHRRSRPRLSKAAFQEACP